MRRKLLSVMVEYPCTSINTKRCYAAKGSGYYFIKAEYWPAGSLQHQLVARCLWQSLAKKSWFFFFFGGEGRGRRWVYGGGLFFFLNLPFEFFVCFCTFYVTSYYVFSFLPNRCFPCGFTSVFTINPHTLILELLSVHTIIFLKMQNTDIAYKLLQNQFLHPPPHPAHPILKMNGPLKK